MIHPLIWTLFTTLCDQIYTFESPNAKGNVYTSSLNKCTEGQTLHFNYIPRTIHLMPCPKQYSPSIQQPSAKVCSALGQKARGMWCHYSFLSNCLNWEHSVHDISGDGIQHFQADGVRPVAMFLCEEKSHCRHVYKFFRLADLTATVLKCSFSLK
jgi:hypothetical protein